MCKIDTTEEICLNIKRYFGSKGITLTKAAEMLGVTLSAVTNQLSNKRPFGKHNALKYAEAFGFDPQYLQTGVGQLAPGEQAQTPSHAVNAADDDVRIPRETLEMYTNLTETLRLLAGLVDRYAPRDVAAMIKGGIYPRKEAGK